MQVSPILPRRLAIVGVCLLCLVACCGLAWWQWERFSSANGTFQNLGYVLQWPLFGLFPAFMFWRMRTLRRQAAEQEAQQVPDGSAEPGGVPAVTSVSASPPAPTEPGGTHRPHPDGEDEQDDELARYNRYLAELNRADTAAADSGPRDGRGRR